jgi:MFS family permease
MTVAAVIPLITLEWALSATAAGAIVSSFTFCYAASVFGFAWAADYFGAKRMVAVSAVCAAAASAAFGFLARDWWSAVLAYGLVGLAQGGVYTPLVMLLSDEVAPASRGRAMGWLIASTSAGYCTSLGAAALGIALGGWQAACLLSGLLFGVSPWLLLIVGLVWGFAVVGDSAQFSTMVTELADQSYVGTASPSRRHWASPDCVTIWLIDGRRRLWQRPPPLAPVPPWARWRCCAQFCPALQLADGLDSSRRHGRRFSRDWASVLIRSATP